MKQRKMRNCRPVAVLVAAAIAIVAGLAGASPAQAEDPIVKLVSVQNGMCLQPASLVEGDVIVQQPCTGIVAQQWTVTIVSNRVHLVNRASRFCLEVREGAINGARIDQWGCGPISNENWTFGIGNNLLGSRVSGTSSHCIATPGSQAGLPVSLRFCDGNASQLWNRPPG